MNVRMMKNITNQNFNDFEDDYNDNNDMNLENENLYLTDFSRGNSNNNKKLIKDNFNKQSINKIKNKANIYNSLLANIKNLNITNSENKKAVISLQTQYENFQKTIISKISEFFSTSKLNYNTKLLRTLKTNFGKNPQAENRKHQSALNDNMGRSFKLQPKKASEPISITESGILTSFKSLQH